MRDATSHRAAKVEAIARWLHEHDSEAAFTWESTAAEWRELAIALLDFMDTLEGR